MKVTFLGTGTSIGVPAIGCNCEVCRSSDPRDKRLRSSALLETDKGLRILIDCGPDFRQQIMNRFGKLDAVLLTHVHYDHVGGVDDLRPFAWFGDVDIYAQQDVIDTLHTTMPYCFKEHLYPGVPLLKLHEVVAGRPFTISRPKEYVAQFPGSGATLEGVMHREGHAEVIPAIGSDACCCDAWQTTYPGIPFWQLCVYNGYEECSRGNDATSCGNKGFGDKCFEI